MGPKQIEKLGMGSYPIADYKGLRLDVRSGGVRTWTWRHRTGERLLKQVALGRWPSMSQADAIAEIENLKSGRTDPIVGELVMSYVAGHLRVRRKHPDRTVGLLEKHTASLWATKATAVGRTEAAALINSLRGTNATAHMLRRELLAVWDHAGMESNPWARIKTRPNPPRQRCLSENEIVSWYKWVNGGALSRTVRDALMLMLLTGCRSGEIVAMEWDELDLNAGAWQLPGSKGKTGVGRTVWLNEWAVELLRGRRTLMEGNDLWHIGRGGRHEALGDTWLGDATALGSSISLGKIKKPMGPMCVKYAQAGRPSASDAGGPNHQAPNSYVFPSRTGGSIKQPRLVNAVHRARHLAQLEQFTIHDTRRVVRSSLARLGCPDAPAEMVLGHKPSGIQAVYQVYKWDAEQKHWLSVWCEYLRDLLLTK